LQHHPIREGDVFCKGDKVATLCVHVNRFHAPIGGCLIKLDIINEVVNRTGITKTKAEMAVETVFETMKKALSEGDRIELRGFGIFNVRPRKTGIGRNPRTGAEVAIPPGKAVRFKPGKELQTLH
jgi:DNA-binding protein HU-beta